MKLNLEVSESDLRKMVLCYFRNLLGDLGETLKPEDIRIQVKSTQNYKSEWEEAHFRAVVNK